LLHNFLDNEPGGAGLALSLLQGRK